jgi:hypothetical protein
MPSVRQALVLRWLRCIDFIGRRIFKIKVQKSFSKNSQNHKVVSSSLENKDKTLIFEQYMEKFIIVTIPEFHNNIMN